MNNSVSKTKKLMFILSCVLVAVCVALFLLIAIKYSTSKSFVIDGKLIDFSRSIRNDALTNFFKLLTHLGSFITVIILTIILILIVYHKTLKKILKNQKKIWKLFPKVKW